MDVNTVISNSAHRTNQLLTATTAVDLAKGMANRLDERAVESECLRRCPDKTIDELHSSGLLRMMQPKRFGGSELGMTECLDVTLELAKACPSTAWVFTNLASHAWTIGQLSERAQMDVWASDPQALAATGLAFPCGIAHRTEGGYQVSGRWPFASGVDASNWMIVGAMTDSGDGSAPHRRFFLIPRPDFQSLDNWNAYGLAGSGSHDVQAKDVWVPEHRTISAEIFAAGRDLPGGQMYKNPVFRMPTFVAFAYFLCIVPLGAAIGAQERFIRELRVRAGTYTGAKLADLTSVQRRIAESTAATDFAHAVLRKDWQELESNVADGIYPSLETKLKWKRNVAFASQLIFQSIDVLMPAAGAGGLDKGSYLQRHFRDIHAASAHVALTWDIHSSAYGQSALGIPPQAGLLL